MAGYGTLEPPGMRREGRSKRGAATILTTMIVAGSFVLVAVLLLAASNNDMYEAPVELSDVEDTIPAVVDELQHHVNIDEKKSWMKEVFEAAKSKKQLHPLSDLDPFTNKPMDGSDFQSILRQHATKAITDTVEVQAKEDMSAAQQAARDAVGADAGCSHRMLNQSDYRGVQSTSVTGQDCLEWKLAGILYMSDAKMGPVYESMEGNYCRNPEGSDKLGAWCFLKSADAAAIASGAEGEAWEYCDIGSRCAVDVPILSQNTQNGLSTQQLRDVGTQVHTKKAASQKKGVAKADDEAENGLRKHGMSSKQAREVLADKNWLKLDKNAGKINPSIKSYMSSKDAYKQLKAEGLI